MWRRETAEERVTRLTNDQLLSPESGSVSVITGIQSSPTPFAKKNKKENIRNRVCVSFLV